MCAKLTTTQITDEGEEKTFIFPMKQRIRNGVHEE